MGMDLEAGIVAIWRKVGPSSYNDPTVTPIKWPYKWVTVAIWDLFRVFFIFYFLPLNPLNHHVRIFFQASYANPSNISRIIKIDILRRSVILRDFLCNTECSHVRCTQHLEKQFQSPHFNLPKLLFFLSPPPTKTLTL